ncbi:MAG: Rrf2 family transcriptional regulator [Oscillospiraceae bacterium]|jgi:Rrf2 family protein|nr:Rrf2 family transcriptional regulator [Oscillospiraceae bacterium]
MLISRRYDYAIRIVRVLSDGEKHTINQICTKEHIPLAFAYKIAKALEQCSIIEGQSGSNGGFQLSKEPEDISLADIYGAVEGELVINECLMKGAFCLNNGNGNACKVHKALTGLQDNLKETLSKLNMKNML